MELQKQKHINQLQQVRNFEALVRRMTEQIRDSLDETQVLQTVTQELAELLNLERCQIELYNTCQTLVTITYEYTTNLPQHQGLTREIAEHLEVYQPLLQKQPLQFLEIVPGWQPKLSVMSQICAGMATKVVGYVSDGLSNFRYSRDFGKYLVDKTITRGF